MKYSFLFFITFISINLFGQEKLKVVATASMIADMAKNIAGEHLDIECIVPIGGDPHIYKPTPSDARLAASADLILRNGLTFEGWLNELIENSGTKGEVVTVTEGVDVIESSTYQNSADPHAWMSAKEGLVYLKNIKDAFIRLAPDHKEAFEKNYTSYSQEVETLDNYIETEIKSIPESRRVLITSHDAFQYYGRRYGIRLEAILGTSTDAQEQTSDITRVNKIIRSQKIPAVFVESTINPKLLKQLATDNNIAVGGELFADSIGDKDSGGDSYLKMLKHNTDVIVAALKSLKEGSTKTAGDSDNKGESIITYGILALLCIGGFLYVVKKLNN